MPKKTPPTALVVDLRGRSFDTFDAFWDAVVGPLGLPAEFGRNPDALRDTLQAGGVSEVVDGYDVVVVHVDRQGIFTSRDRETRALRAAFAGRRSQLLVHPLT
ncbi:barstar family protein [Streptomyces sp. YU58]|uniref:barstar family protein n=1 Tax=Streptomyces sp. SX92 TaxID=3158972 RepID=UPI0027BA80AD|nr:barstar family protein [Streptomyces coralus]WLW54697.1 barstar family protein [Streptomyces coralus]